MNKWIVASLVLMCSGSLYAADATGGQRVGKVGMAGCGLGSMVWEKNTKMYQVMAGTTNGTSGSQTFGISSETSNCVDHGMVMRDKEQEVFVSMNFETLTHEMAKGSGETLATFVHLLGCGSDSAMQSAYEQGSIQTSSPEALLITAKQVCQPQS